MVFITTIAILHGFQRQWATTVDINKYAQEDIKKIKQKIDKGINENLYKNFILILTCEHSIDIQQIREYQNLLCNYWESVIDNPFAGLFIVNYDSLLFMQTKQDASYDSTHTPIPILFKNDWIFSNNSSSRFFNW